MRNRNQKSKTVPDARKAIVQTLIYSDLFDFPLTQHELWHYLKNNTAIPKKEFIAGLQSLLRTENISRNEYYTLPGRTMLTRKRKNRQAASERKIQLAKRIGKLLQYIPTIQYIGISGSLALRNANKTDDIDLFFITKARTIWITRLLILGLLEMLGRRRKKHNQNVGDKMCVNLVISDDKLSFPPERHDIYTAHEIAQLVPLSNKGYMYERFLAENAWITNFLPNIRIPKAIKRREPFFSCIATFLLKLGEQPAKKIQLISINKTRTTEKIDNGILAFHPVDNRTKTLMRYSAALKKYLKN